MWFGVSGCCNVDHPACDCRLLGGRAGLAGKHAASSDRSSPQSRPSGPANHVRFRQGDTRERACRTRSHGRQYRNGCAECLEHRHRDRSEFCPRPERRLQALRSGSLQHRPRRPLHRTSDVQAAGQRFIRGGPPGELERRLAGRGADWRQGRSCREHHRAYQSASDRVPVERSHGLRFRDGSGRVPCYRPAGQQFFGDAGNHVRARPVVVLCRTYRLQTDRVSQAPWTSARA